MSYLIGIEFFWPFFPLSEATWLANVTCQVAAVTFAIASVAVPCRAGPRQSEGRRLAAWSICAALAAVMMPLLIGLMSPNIVWTISIEQGPWPWALALFWVVWFSMPAVAIAGLALMVARRRARGLPSPAIPTSWHGSSGNLVVVVLVAPVVAFVFVAATLTTLWWYS